MNTIYKMLIAFLMIATGNSLAAAETVPTKVADANTTFELYVKDKLVEIAQFKVNGGTVLQADFSPTGVFEKIGILGKKKMGDTARAQIRVNDAKNFLIFLELKNDRGSYKYTIRPGNKVVLVSFAPDKTPALYPQTGPLKGLLGKTESGLSLKNNVVPNEIVADDTRTALEKVSGAFTRS